MKVRKFCLCGVKLERDVADEDTARRIVTEFRRAHIGDGHGPANYREYISAVSRIVARNAKVNKPRQVRPLLKEICRIEADSPHEWINAPGLVFCAVCKVVKSATATQCTGAALMRPSEFVGYPLPWLRGLAR